MSVCITSAWFSLVIPSVIAHSVNDPLYYLHNFRQVLDWLRLRYADLLDTEEQEF